MNINKIVISKEQYNIVKGLANYTQGKEFDICYSIIEFGVAFLLCLSFEKMGGGENDVNVSKLINSLNSSDELKKFSSSITSFLELEDKNKYIVGKSFLSYIGINTINITPEQKRSIQNASVYSGKSERDCSHYTFDAGITIFQFANITIEQKVEDYVLAWMKDEDVMKIADAYRKAWEVGGQEINKLKK